MRRASAISGDAERAALADPGLRPRRRNYGRWRAATLIGVHVLIGLHIAHWSVTGSTLAPLELNEVMYTLELGIVTAGFLFMLTLVVCTAIFGRFFCSWGCHILALQDLCAWLLGKVGIRPKPVRSRVLLYVPIGAMAYMFIWPQVARLVQGLPAPALHLRTDSQGWASFVTQDFWRNLPGPGVAALTFLVCGFLIVYVLGTRSFCRYACPYGAVFALADRIAPGKITARGDCSNCGLCTAACTSNIRVHEELTVFGKVVSPSCLKDLDCVAACPEGNVAYAFTRPSGFASLKASAPRVPYDFSLLEDVLMAIVFLASLLIFRGLYGLVPFLLALGVGGILAYLSVVCVRLARAPNVRLNNFQFKYKGALTKTGCAAVALLFGLAFLTVHSGFIRWHEWRGNRLHDEVIALVRAGADPMQLAVLEPAVTHLESVARFGLITPSYLDERLARLLLLADRRTEAAPYLASMYQRQPARSEEMRGDIHYQYGRIEEALRAYEAAVLLEPTGASARQSLALLLSQTGRPGEAAHHWRVLVDQAPETMHLRHQLVAALTQAGQMEEAIIASRALVNLSPTNAEGHNNLGWLLLNADAQQEAEQQFREAIRLNPKLAHAHFNLGHVLALQQRFDEAEPHLRTAAQLDHAYAEMLDEGMRAEPSSPQTLR